LRILRRQLSLYTLKLRHLPLLVFVQIQIRQSIV
jgi:hypothetical protein